MGTGDTNNGEFWYWGDGRISLKNLPAICQGALTYSFRASVTDQDGLSDVHHQAILYDGPTALNFVPSSNNIPEDNVETAVLNVGSMLTTWSTSASIYVTYTLHDSGTYPDNAKFTIGSSNGQIDFIGDSTVGKNSWSISVKIIENTTKACKI